MEGSLERLSQSKPSRENEKRGGVFRRADFNRIEQWWTF